jgi:uncharacterized membrane protein (DUF485 family)
MTQHSDHNEAAASRSRLGLTFFLLYVVLYAGFMGLNAFAPQLMSRTPFGGVNFATLYGLGLIIAAFVLALLYAMLSSSENADDRGGER